MLLGLYIGGQFWNGRANDLATQAEKPLLNPVEMAMPDQWAVVSRLKENPRYVNLFQKVYQLADSTPKCNSSNHAASRNKLLIP